jgi:hypothetical protein
VEMIAKCVSEANSWRVEACLCTFWNDECAVHAACAVRGLPRVVGVIESSWPSSRS